jgi:hypothetical protein
MRPEGIRTDISSAAELTVGRAAGLEGWAEDED